MISQRTQTDRQTHGITMPVLCFASHGNEWFSAAAIYLLIPQFLCTSMLVTKTKRS